MRLVGYLLIVVPLTVHWDIATRADGIVMESQGCTSEGFAGLESTSKTLGVPSGVTVASYESSRIMPSSSVNGSVGGNKLGRQLYRFQFERQLIKTRNRVDLPLPNWLLLSYALLLRRSWPAWKEPRTTAYKPWLKFVKMSVWCTVVDVLKWREPP